MVDTASVSLVSSERGGTHACAAAPALAEALGEKDVARTGIERDLGPGVGGRRSAPFNARSFSVWLLRGARGTLPCGGCLVCRRVGRVVVETRPRASVAYEHDSARGASIAPHEGNSADARYTHKRVVVIGSDQGRCEVVGVGVG